MTDNMKIRYLAFFVSILAACTTLEKHSFPQEDPERVVISDRISNQRVNAFAEDADGHIWIATFRGLNKYSVHEFHQYFCADDTTGLPDNQVNTVFKSADGRLWVATVNGLAYHTDKGCFKRVPILSDNRNISRILETARGDMLSATVLPCSGTTGRNRS